MPKLKQPDPLQKMAYDSLLEMTVNCCDGLCPKGSLEDFRKCISAIKTHVCNNMPWNFLPDFCSNFLECFYLKIRASYYTKAALEIMMDTDIAGLRCEGRIVFYLDSEHAHRLRRLAVLNLNHFLPTVPTVLNNFHLNDLTTFISRSKCNDLELEIIGKNCLKLTVLDISGSKDVTDDGLRALSLCSELRIVEVTHCSVSLSGLNRLLSVHKKLEKFTVLDYKRYSCSNNFSHLDSSLCPSIKHFVFENVPRTDSMVRQRIFAKFPNITELEIDWLTLEDVYTLISLDNLTKIAIHCRKDELGEAEIEQTWLNLTELLTFIGPDITTLDLRFPELVVSWERSDINFIFTFCPNIEHLTFHQYDVRGVIPPFQKLKTLFLCRSSTSSIYETIEFGKMPSLETLVLCVDKLSLQAIESMMLDNVKFPNLKVIKTNRSNPEDFAHIQRIAKSKNLDFTIEPYFAQ